MSKRRFRIECQAAGSVFTWTGDAENEADALRRAASAMVANMPWTHAREIQATAVVEVTRAELQRFEAQLREGPL